LKERVPVIQLRNAKKPLALARDAMNADRRIINAKGKRPVLRNLEPAAVDHFQLVP
jgi:tetrahydromethanopterin S-methyltransferase subunit A